MVFKFVFFDPAKNNIQWWNRLFDRLPPIEKRTWKILKGGCNLGDKEATFEVLDIKTNAIPKEQEQYDEIISIFFINQINIEKFFIDNQDVSDIIKRR